ncbi:MAG: hypothetical protein ACI915_001842 [Gammaproteobacteria bacterium]
MPITNPRHYSDKTVAWTAEFLRRRALELAPLITSALLEEHAKDPRGTYTPHSYELKQVLDFIHNQPTDGKSFAYAVLPYAQYRLGIMRGRDVAPSIDDTTNYTSEHEAVHAVFLERLKTLGLLPSERSEATK